MPSFGSAKNPVDLTGMAGDDWYHDTVKLALSMNGLMACDSLL